MPKSLETDLNLSQNAITVLERRYLKKDNEGHVIETPEDMFRRVAKNIARADKLYDSNASLKDTEEKFYNMMAELDFLPNSPTLMNAGRELQQLSACFVLPVEDSIESIFDTIKNTALIHQSGGGTGFSFSRIRPKNDIVMSTKGIASGPISFMKVFNTTTETIKQGGCVDENTLISTEKGIFPIKELGKASQGHYETVELNVFTDEGIKPVEQFYNNGTKEVKTIVTSYGYKFTGTLDHKIRIIDKKGNYVWKELKDIKKGDWAALQMNSFTGEILRFPEFDKKFHHNTCKIPEEMSVSLAELAGYFTGDGCFHKGKLMLSVPHDCIELKDYFDKFFNKNFDIESRVEQKKNDKSINLIYHSQMLVEWLKFIGIEKEHSSTATIPPVIFRTDKVCAEGFLRGLFEADGYIDKKGYHIALSSVSEQLIREVQLLLLGLGIPSGIRVNSKRENAYGKNNLYILTISTPEGLKVYKEKIGFLSHKKKERLSSIIKRDTNYNDLIPNQGEKFRAFYEKLIIKPKHPFYRKIYHYLDGVKDRRNLTRQKAEILIKEHDCLKESFLSEILERKQFFDQVQEINTGEAPTLDLVVPDNHTYIANGFVSHNTRRGANMGILRCLSGNSIIHTITGKKLIKDLVGQQPYVYACDPEDKSVHIVRADKIFISDTNRDIVRVWLDNDNYIDCTPDHRFMLSNGNYKEACNLNIGDSLMAFDKRIVKHGKNRYVYAIGCTNGKKILEHRAVLKDIYKFTVNYEDINVQHIDGNSLNNKPDNITYVNRSEHAKEHTSQLMLNQVKIAKFRKGKSSEEIYGIEKAKEIKEKQSKARKGKKPWNKDIDTDDYKNHYIDGFSNQFTSINNHKVVKIEYIGKEDNVYDISLPCYHNFVVNEVFVHNCDHPEIMEFITCKKEEGDMNNFNISVALTDKFMEALKQNSEYELINPRTGKPSKKLKAKEVFEKITDLAWQNGEPGIIFIDQINRNNPTPLIGDIESTNPCGELPLLPYESCFAPETRIVTINGLETVENLYEKQNKGEEIIIATNLNGIRNNIIFRPARVIKTGIKKVIRLTLDNGQSIRLTADHKIMTDKGWEEAGKLTKDDKVMVQTEKAGELYFNSSDEDKKLYQMFGWFTGDGWFTKTCGLTFGPKDNLAFDTLFPIWKKFTDSDNKVNEQKNFVRCISTYKKSAIENFKKFGFKEDKGPKKRIPSSLYTAPKQLQIAYLQGLFSADGTKTTVKSQVSLSSASLELLRDVQLILLNLGIRSNIKYYEVRSRGRSQGQLRVNGENYIKFLDIVGFKLTPYKDEKCNLYNQQRIYHNKPFINVHSIEEAGETVVYDLNESVTNSLIAEGMIVHNCNLASINLARMAITDQTGKPKINYKKLRNLIHNGVHFLDNVIDMNKYPLKQIEEMTKGNRKIGLGVMGFTDMLIQLEIPYNSAKAIQTAEEVMKFISIEAKDASARLAEKRGVFPNFLGSIYDKANEIKMRNSTVNTIAPTGSISIIAGCSSGIEPLFALCYTRNILDNDKLVEVNTYFKEIAHKRGFYSPELMNTIAEKGSIQDITTIPEDVRRVFVISHDITPEWHVKMQAAFQRYTDNAVSKTINFPNHATKEDVKESYLLAYESGCKGLTVYRDGSRNVQVLSMKIKPKEEDAKKSEKGDKSMQSLATKEEMGSYKLQPRPRPMLTKGATIKMPTGCGHLYITINEDQTGLCEVFTRMGKSGGCAASQAEVTGRLISLALRAGVDTKSIVKQIRGIRCPSPCWDKGNMTLSCADAIGKAIEHYVETNGSATLDKTEVASFNLTGICPECPECGSMLEFSEGCVVCRGCGFSQCG